MKKLFALTGLMALFGAALTGCGNTADGVAKDADKAGEVAADGAMKAGNAVENATEGAVKATEEAGENAAGALAITPMVKEAIVADAGLNNIANKIDVDTKDGVVYLKGHVATTELKKKATQIAEARIKEAGKTDTVKNELEVKAH